VRDKGGYPGFARCGRRGEYLDSGRETMLREFKGPCPYCGERLLVEVDLSAGLPQEFVYDCVVCCRPIEASVTPGSRGEPVLRLRSEDDLR
jgi:DNA-directed RNA polymerase subunit RPC12/RpoP